MSGPFTSPVAYSVPFDNQDLDAVTAGINSDNVFDAIIEVKSDALNNDRYPVDCFYNGHAGVNRFLEFFPNITSAVNGAPFIPPENTNIVTIVAGAVSNSTGTICIYKNGNYTTPLYTITFTNQKRVIVSGPALASLNALDEISIKVATGSFNKPFIRLWLNTVT